MTPREEAQRFLDLLRQQTYSALGSRGSRLDEAGANDWADQFARESLSRKDRQDPQWRALLEHAYASATRNPDEAFSGVLAAMQEKIEQTAATRVEAREARPPSPLVAHLRTGQLNAVSMRVPGGSGAYLVLFEDQMPLFAWKLCKAVVWAIPHDPPREGKLAFHVSVSAVTERIESDPQVAGRFAELVAAYTTIGDVRAAANHLLPSGYLNFASHLLTALEYFVLGHEYAHVLLGHLDTTPARKGVLPASDAEALAYSWQQELDADRLGMTLSINALIRHERLGMDLGFQGIGLFFDALYVMDRAVALLQTGDQTAWTVHIEPRIVFIASNIGQLPARALRPGDAVILVVVPPSNLAPATFPCTGRVRAAAAWSGWHVAGREDPGRRAPPSGWPGRSRRRVPAIPPSRRLRQRRTSPTKTRVMDRRSMSGKIRSRLTSPAGRPSGPMSPCPRVHPVLDQAGRHIVYIDMINETAIGGRRHRFVSHVIEIDGLGDGATPATQTIFGPGLDGRARPRLQPQRTRNDLQRAGFDLQWLNIGDGMWDRPLNTLIGGQQ